MISEAVTQTVSDITPIQSTRPAVSSKPLYALVAGKREHHPEGVYHFRYLKEGKRIWQNVGVDAESAFAARMKRERMIQALAAEIDLASVAESSQSAQEENVPSRLPEFRMWSPPAGVAT